MNTNNLLIAVAINEKLKKIEKLQLETKELMYKMIKNIGENITYSNIDGNELFSKDAKLLTECEETFEEDNTEDTTYSNIDGNELILRKTTIITADRGY